MPGGQSESFSFFGDGLEEESGLFSGDFEDRSTGRLLLETAEEVTGSDGDGGLPGAGGGSLFTLG